MNHWEVGMKEENFLCNAQILIQKQSASQETHDKIWRHVDKCPIMHWTALTTKNYLIQNVNSTAIEKP